MCGICGIIRKDGGSVPPETIAEMCESIYHRGPDGHGLHIDGSIGLGMRRLKVIDLDTGDQPIHNEDKSIWIVFNGEIYNYLILKKQLEAVGHRFYTNSDTEVIVHAYEEYQEQCLNRLNGMFSFAIWDSNKNKVLIGRDRLGIKPLYYYIDDKKIVFCSEIKGILRNSEVLVSLNYEALNDYFSFLYVPSPDTIFSDINKLPAGHFMIIKNNNIVIKRYWQLKYSDSYPFDEEEVIQSTIKKLARSIEFRMISDVPLGAYLSGGTDSGIVTSLMSSMSQRPVETFSIIWGEGSEAFDERRYARIVSDRYTTNHHEFLVKPDIEEVASQLIEYFDEPFGDASAIPNYYLARETRKYVTVALSGLGGDELAGGYERYLGMKLAKYFNLVPRFLRKRFLEELVNRLPDSYNGSHFINRFKRFVKSSDYNFLERYFGIVATFDNNEKQRLFSKDLNKIIRNSSIRHYNYYDCESHIRDGLNRLLYLDLNTYLVDDLLTLTDRMSMAHSLEVRVPFLDHNVVEHFARTDPRMKLRGFSKKHILKKIAKKYLPKKVIYRKKMGFSVPLVLWLRDSLTGYARYILNKKSIEKTNLFEIKEVERILNEHIMGKVNYDEKIWSLIVFMLWYDRYIEKVY